MTFDSTVFSAIFSTRGALRRLLLAAAVVAFTACGTSNSEPASHSKPDKSDSTSDGGSSDAQSGNDSAADSVGGLGNDSSADSVGGTGNDLLSSDTNGDAITDAGSGADAIVGLVGYGFTAAELLEYCVRKNSCIGFDVGICLDLVYNGSPGALLPGGLLTSEPEIQCIKSHGGTGCAPVNSCINYSKVAGGTCAASSYCDVGDKMGCNDVNGQRLTIRSKCQDLFAGATSCATTTHPQLKLGCASAATCSGSSATPYCEGTNVAVCENGNAVLISNCSRVGTGLPCNKGKCTGPGEACTGDIGGCESSDVRWRCYSGKVMRWRCSELGSTFSCAKDPLLGGSTCSQGSQCGLFTTPKCVNSELEVCNGGVLQRVDCKSLGFAGCQNGLCTE